MIFSRYRRASLRAIPIVLVVSFVFTLILVGTNPFPAFGMFVSAFMLGLAISATTAVSAIVASVLALTLVDRRLQRSAKARILTVMVAAFAAPVLVSLTITAIDALRFDGQYTGWGTSIIIGAIAGVVASIAATILVSLDEDRATHGTPKSHAVPLNRD